MEIKKLENVKVKCDFVGCSNMANYAIDLKRGIFGGTTDICSSCLNELYELSGKFIVPKSPQNIIKQKEMERKNAKKER